MIRQLPSRKAPLAALAVLLASCGNDKTKSHEPFQDLYVDRKGSGAVTSQPEGILCGDACVAPFRYGTVVELTALPEYPGAFVGWSGPCEGTGICKVTADSSRTVFATFLNALTVHRDGPGVVKVEPTGTVCDVPCAGLYQEGAVVTLTATPSSNATFEGWSGDCVGSGACVVTMIGSRNVTAKFKGPSTNTHQLVVNVIGNGAVASAPTGIQCPAACGAPFTAGETVTLTATPIAGAEFLGWTGGGCSGTALTCIVTMDASKSVTARFEQPNPCNWSWRAGGTYLDRATGLAIDVSGQLAMSGTIWGRVDLGGGPLDVATGASNYFVATYTADGAHRTSFGFGKSGTANAVMHGSGLAWTPDGDLVATGAFSGAVNLGDGPRTDTVTTPGLFQGFVGRYSVSGAARWVRALSATSSMFDGISSVAVDSRGEAIVTGEFYEPNNFGGATTFTPVESDLFVARYANDGAFVWAKAVGGGSYERSLGIITLPDDSVVFTGNVSEGSDFGGGAIPSGRYNEAFVTKLNTDGSYGWTRNWGTASGLDNGRAVARGPAGELVAVGEFEGTITVGTTSLSSAGFYDTYVVKLDSTGAVAWAKRLGGTGTEEPRAVAVDSAGNIFVGGVFVTTSATRSEFGFGQVASNGESVDIFVVKLSPSGDPLWAKTFGGSESDELTAMVLDRTGNAIITGSFQQVINFGFGQHQTAGYQDIFLACIGK